METLRTQRSFRGLAAGLGGFALCSGALSAAPFLYVPGDVVLAFRQSGGALDYVVNIGKASAFASLPTGTHLVVTNLAASQLRAGFPTLNGLQWSAAAANRPPLVAAYPLQTIWVTAPRLDPAVAAPAWLRKGSFVQGTAAGQIDAIGANAAISSGNQVAGPNNTATGVLIPSASDLALGPVLGDSGNLSGTFQGSVESVTPEDFATTPGAVSRADFFELVPGTSADGSLNTKGRYLGYFELAGDGVLTFHTGAPAPVAPKIVGIQRTGNQTTVQVVAAGGVRYTLRASDSLSARVSTWSVVAGPVAGTGATLSLQDTTAGEGRFYAVEAQP